MCRNVPEWNRFFIGHMWAACNVLVDGFLQLFKAAGLWISLWRTQVGFSVTVQSMRLYARSPVSRLGAPESANNN